MLCLGSLGSSVRVPTEFWSSSGFGAAALSVRQTPPPATPAQSLHFFAVQSGSATSAVTRLAVSFVAPENEMTPGSVAFCLGPKKCHLCPAPLGSPFLASFAAIALNVSSARWAIAGGITLAG